MGKLLLATVLAVSAVASAQDDPLFAKIWNGVQDAQKKYTSCCGTIVETRTSKILARPMNLRGKFCAQGLTRFFLEYSGTDAVRLLFNEDYLNVTTGPAGNRKTEVFRVGEHVRRTQAYLSQPDSIRNLKSNFAISLREDAKVYEMRLVPRSDRFKSRVNYIAIKLLKSNFLLRSLEVDGKTGVNSVFDIQVTETNAKISDDVFRVYKPK